MLNFDVKRKINTLRDILVGKVPDPKAQVEQITIALIYKFMDDMDMDGVAFGGNREFFKDDYEKYAFSQLMQSENSAQQRLNLYAEGIDKMTLNPNLPQLFRDIFRGAYIPYRDPETLNMFLKEIAEFSYDDSEDLGNAFEYLLSIMGSQGDAGQFRTPRHIIDMMVAITAPQKNETVLDPACGTAGFLISAYKYIKACNKDKDGNSTLTADDKNRMISNFAGYDISPDMVRLSRVNMYFHGFTKPQISEYDTLTSLDKWDDYYDVIFANPPFMTPKGGIIPHSRYRVSAKRAEVLFVDYIAEHLNPTGRAAVIVPEGIVFQSATAYKNLRKYIVEDGLLYAVISLPAGVFNPYSGVKTSILLMDKTLAKQRDSILFVKLNNDGYDLGAQRRPVSGSEIPDVINVLQDYQNGRDVEDRVNVTLAKKTDIAEQDYILVGERYKVATVDVTAFPIVKLGDVCTINDQSFDPSNEERFIYVDISAVDGKTGTINYSNALKGSDAPSRARRLFIKDDILLSTVRPNLRAFAHVDREDTSYCVASTGFAVVRCGRNVNSKYLYYLLLHDSLVAQMVGMMGKGAYPSINQNDVSNLRFPLPSLTVQEEIVAEIDGYQKIIDGARQVVENYKPTIKIDPSWEIMKLKDVCDVRDGTHDSPAYVLNGYPLVTSKNVKNGRINFDGANFVSEEDFKAINLRSKVDIGDIIMPMIGTIGGPAIVDFEPNFAIKNVALIKFDNKTLMNEYAFLVLSSPYFIDYIENTMRGGTQKFISLKDIRVFPIPIPPIETQHEIVARINEEMSIVEQNKRLIEIFQQKIKDKISEVWGE